MQKSPYLFKDAEQALQAAVDKAIEQAARTSGPELRSLGSRISPQEYFTDVLMRNLFLRLCGADLTTHMGGDPEAAWKFLYMGRNVARHWEKERGGPAALRKKRERPEDVQRDMSERQQLALSVENMALKTVIRVLVDHARASDPHIDERLEAAIDARHAGIDHPSDADREFTDKAKAYLSLLTVAPSK